MNIRDALEIMVPIGAPNEKRSIKHLSVRQLKESLAWAQRELPKAVAAKPKAKPTDSVKDAAERYQQWTKRVYSLSRFTDAAESVLEHLK